jgi:putative effector of murein hydrolase
MYNFIRNPFWFYTCIVLFIIYITDAKFEVYYDDNDIIDDDINEGSFESI